jgi:hypothetical protein
MKLISVIARTAKRSGVSRCGPLDCFAALALTGALAVQSPALAQTQALPRGTDKAPDAVRPLVGAWDLEMVGAARKCTVTFGAEPSAQGRQLRFPAICRRALPILTEAQAWTSTASGVPGISDAAGKALVVFESGTPESGFAGKGLDGKSYRLDPKGHPRAQRRPQQSAAEIAATAAQRPTAVDPARAPAPDTLPGRYSVMRQANREACKISLNAGPANATGRAPAALEASCQETGLLIFDPAGWRYAAGRLTLFARKGHSVDLVFENGQWRKDPAVGAPLLLRKLAP